MSREKIPVIDELRLKIRNYLMKNIVHLNVFYFFTSLLIQKIAYILNIIGVKPRPCKYFYNRILIYIPPALIKVFQDKIPVIIFSDPVKVHQFRTLVKWLLRGHENILEHVFAASRKDKRHSRID